MDKEVLNFVVGKTGELINSSSCCDEAKEVAQVWLDSIGTEKEAEETKKYIKELEEDLVPIDGMIEFAESDHAVKIFGEETAKNIAVRAKEIKATGGKYCFCDACAAAEAILDKKDEILK